MERRQARLLAAKELRRAACRLAHAGDFGDDLNTIIRLAERLEGSSFPTTMPDMQKMTERDWIEEESQRM